MKSICKSITILLISFFILFQYSCKKKETTPATDTTPVAPTSPDPNNCFGLLSSSKIAIWQGGILTNNGGYCNASFSSQALINNGVVFNTSLDPGAVSVNGITLKKNNYSGMVAFNDTTYSIIATPHTWSVSGANGVPNISYSNTGAYPTYTGYNVLPDTIYLSQNNTISLQGVGGADEIEVFLSSITNSSKLKFVSGSSTSVVLGPSDLTSLSPTIGGLLNVICFKNTYQLIGGKTYKFQIGYQVEKVYVVIK